LWESTADPGLSLSRVKADTEQQTVKIISLDHPSGLIRTGDRSKVVFEFISQAEFVKEGQLILLREAKTKVLGVVTKILG
jgi:GTPase